MKKIFSILPVVIVGLLSACDWQFQKVSQIMDMESPITDMRDQNNIPELACDKPAMDNRSADDCSRPENAMQGFCSFSCMSLTGNLTDCVFTKSRKFLSIEPTQGSSKCQCGYGIPIHKPVNVVARVKYKKMCSDSGFGYDITGYPYFHINIENIEKAVIWTPSTVTAPINRDIYFIIEANGKMGCQINTKISIDNLLIYEAAGGENVIFPPQ